MPIKPNAKAVPIKSWKNNIQLFLILIVAFSLFISLPLAIWLTQRETSLDSQASGRISVGQEPLLPSASQPAQENLNGTLDILILDIETQLAITQAEVFISVGQEFDRTKTIFQTKAGTSGRLDATLSPRDYTLLIEAKGYQPETVTITLDAGRFLPLSIHLTPIQSSTSLFSIFQRFLTE
jgi:hypothetical protein